MVTIEEAQANSEMMNAFIEENMGLVRMALKQLHYPQSDDFLQEGAIGLYKAVNRFDLGRGVKFSTYAVPMIVGEIRRHIRDRDYLHITGGLKVSREIRKIYSQSLRLEGCDDIEICGELNITQEQLNEARTAMSICKSLDVDVHQDDSGDAPITLYNIVADGSDFAQDAIEEMFKEEFFNCLVQKLDEKSLNILELHLQEKVQTEIAREVGLTQVQVSRILKKIVDKGKQLVEGGMKLKITKDQMLMECRTLGMSDEAVNIIAGKYNMTPGSVKNCIYRYGIKKDLISNNRPMCQRCENPPAKIEPVPEAINDTSGKVGEPIKWHEDKRISLLKVKAWEGKEYSYTFKDNKLLISNGENCLEVEDIATMIMELQELANHKPAV